MRKSHRQDHSPGAASRGSSRTHRQAHFSVGELKVQELRHQIFPWSSSPSRATSVTSLWSRAEFHRQVF